MSINPNKRKCSAVRDNGHLCQAWAMIESDPPLCPAHAGVQRGAGAPEGNRNAVKHGLYMSVMRPDEIADLEMVRSTSLVHELLLTRMALLRLGEHLERENPSLEKLSVIAPLLFSGVRTAAFLLNNIDDNGFDWDVVLDELGNEWGREL